MRFIRLLKCNSLLLLFLATPIISATARAELADTCSASNKTRFQEYANKKPDQECSALKKASIDKNENGESRCMTAWKEMSKEAMEYLQERDTFCPAAAKRFDSCKNSPDSGTKQNEVFKCISEAHKFASDGEVTLATKLISFKDALKKYREENRKAVDDFTNDERALKANANIDPGRAGFNTRDTYKKNFQIPSGQQLKAAKATESFDQLLTEVSGQHKAMSQYHLINHAKELSLEKGLTTASSGSGISGSSLSNGMGAAAGLAGAATPLLAAMNKGANPGAREKSQNDSTSRSSLNEVGSRIQKDHPSDTIPGKSEEASKLGLFSPNFDSTYGLSSSTASSRLPTSIKGFGNSTNSDKPSFSVGGGINSASQAASKKNKDSSSAILSDDSFNALSAGGGLGLSGADTSSSVKDLMNDLNISNDPSLVAEGGFPETNSSHDSEKQLGAKSDSESDSLSLFDRSRATHFRALKKGFLLDSSSIGHKLK